MLKCLRCGRELETEQACTCTHTLRDPGPTPQLLQKDLKSNMALPRPSASASAVPTFSELLQKSKGQSVHSQNAPMGLTPLDEDGNLLTPAMRLAPRINLVGKVQVPVAWTEAGAPPLVPAFDFSSHPAFDSVEDLLPLPSEPKEAAWTQAVDTSPTLGKTLPAKEGIESSLTAEAAPRWRVFGAFLLDGLLVLSFVMGFWQLSLQVVGTESSAGLSVLIPMLLFTAVVAWVYSALFGFLLQGRSFGRLVLGIRLVTRQGEALSSGRAAIRATLSLLSLALFFGGFYMALFSRSRQTLHDWLTRTYPVRLNKHRA